MGPHYRRFLAALAGDAGEPVLFEPFIPTYLTEQLIWRRGAHLWNTVPAYLDTLLALQERTYADVPILDMRIFGDIAAEEMCKEIEKCRSDTLQFAVLCDTPLQYEAAVSSSGVCAVGLYRWEQWYFSASAENKKPLIAMDGECPVAAAHNFAGWFAPENGEEYWKEYQGKITILGGLGADWLSCEEPVTIHRRCEEIFKQTKNAGYMIGSGGGLAQEDYLALISLLGIYRRYR